MFEFEGKLEHFFPSVGLKVTGACRLRCPFCCEPERDQEVYPPERLIEIIELLRKYGTTRLCFTGGEPLLYPSLVKVLKHSHNLGFRNVLLTSDGTMLKQQYEELVQYVYAVRFSIHGIGTYHDSIVGEEGAFASIDEMVQILVSSGCPCFVTTVVSPSNVDEIYKIADWCFSRGIKQYYLFGLMKSGRGNNFIQKIGEVPLDTITAMVEMLKSKYSSNAMDIVHYDYQKKSECILVYGDGRMVIDPYPEEPSYQARIGNIISDSVDQILLNFNKDPENLTGYAAHLEVIPAKHK